jgi:1,4-alpha-glucan branching enzyme
LCPTSYSFEKVQPLPSPTGFLALVLHFHLPFVRHPEQENFLEEDWYYEALYETYLPLLDRFERLTEKKIPFRLTVSLSPTLLALWADPLIQQRAERYGTKLLALVEKERERVKDSAQLAPVVEMYHKRLSAYHEAFLGRWGRNPAQGFKKFRDLGYLEIITCAATHAFLPFLEPCPPALRAQIEVAVKSFEAHMGEKPKGFWLPECAYQPGQDALLKEYDLQYFFVDTHGLAFGTPRPKYGPFAPITTPAGVAVFGRDLESSKQVWSSKEGYPGDPDYRDFYRDIGFDLDHAYLYSDSPHPEGQIKKFTGLKYHRVTGPGPEKEIYDPEKGLAKARAHAADFIEKRRVQTQTLKAWMDRPPLVACLYDAELFGHWWYEGPDFIASLFEESHLNPEAPVWVTPSQYLKLYPRNQVLTPSLSSWGDQGYADFWLNPSNDWIYPPLLKASRRMVQMADHFKRPDALRQRALNQAARELLLAQASDWAFMMKTGNHRSYAESRVDGHLDHFRILMDQAKSGKVNEPFLRSLEERNNLFPELDYRVYRSRS